MKQIKLTQGKFAIVDDKDFAWLNHWKWCYHSTGYALRSIHCYKNGKRSSKVIYMHRIINQTSKSFVTDHINRNKLDNQRNNLRSVSSSRNNLNRSGIRGIDFYKRVKKWRARISIDNKNIMLGYFNNFNDAILARKCAERIYNI